MTGRAAARASALLVVAALALALVPGAQAADPAAAERQYRVARRLIVEGSPDAGAALSKVLELDPLGRLADDALVEQAKIWGIPRWPEELGRIQSPAARGALGLLERVLSEFGESDRAAEARYRKALLRLEPLPGYDASGSRLDLITVATGSDPGGWHHEARYAVAWLDAQQGRMDRARAGFQRLIVDAAGSPVAARARVGLGRVLLGEGEFGAAAATAQLAIEEGVSDDVRAGTLRELAVRSLLSSIAPASTPGRFAPSPEIRSFVDMASAPGGGVVLADGRGTVLRLDAGGASSDTWDLDGVELVAVNALGHVFAAGGESLYRLDSGDLPRKIASQGDFAPVTALAADASGRLWLLDRRGERIGAVEPGAETPYVVWQERGTKLAGITWDGRRLIATDARARQLLRLDSDGSLKPLGGPELSKPIALASDLSGRLAILDSRAGTVIFLEKNGTRLYDYSWRDAGITRPVDVALGYDGALHLYDESDGTWIKLP